MKMTKIVNRMDDALDNLLTVHSTLNKHVESADGARVAAAMMLPAIDTLLSCHQRLMDKAAKSTDHRGGKP